MKFKSRVTAGIAVTASSIGLLLGSSAPAQAVPGGPAFCIPPTGGYDGCFWSTGDKFGVADNAADGKRTVLIWKTSYGRSGECHDSNGTLNGYKYCDVNLWEGPHANGKPTIVTFSVAIRKGKNGKNESMSSPGIGYIAGR
ncbi:hypothetical protein [Streptomyces boluensis]|uniref:Secreted protein n=1 Tax=Streptomyces boluensis TaxID=1775135 RepID=A0A964UMX3_9ACTN|nr:hypothetical protein [Streptomyces boluensis]NBE52203.1 hypothetical protein [Streptomyces boluensis]